MKYRLFFAALLTLTMGVSGVSRAQSTDTDIIAVVNGEAITDAHVMMFYKSLPHQYQQVPVETAPVRRVGLVEPPPKKLKGGHSLCPLPSALCPLCHRETIYGNGPNWDSLHS